MMIVASMLCSGWGGNQAISEEVNIKALAEAIAKVEQKNLSYDDLAVRSNLPLARLKLRKAEMLLTGRYGKAESAAAWEIKQGFEALQNLARGKIAYAGHYSGFDWPYDGSRRLYKRGGGLWPTFYEYGIDAVNDGSPQPFLVEVPPNYDPGRPWPLLLYLHGYHGGVDMIRKWDTTSAVAVTAKKLGFLVVAPHGRSETDFLSVGETDVLQALEEMKKYYNVDEDRICLIGGSMGGYGGLNLAFHYPHLWAGVAAFTASSDMMVFGALKRETLLPFRRWHYLWDNPIDLIGNAPNIPITSTYGGRDNWVPAFHGERLSKRRKELGGLYEYSVVQEGGHGVGNAGPAYDKAMEWLKDKKRDPNPAFVRHKTYSLRYDRSYWVRILRFNQWGKAAQIEATAGKDRVDVRTENVGAYELDLSGLLAEGQKEIVVVTNSEESFKGKASEKPIRIQLAPESSSRLQKTRTLCGPFEDIFNHPFLVVRGTSSKDPGRKRAGAAFANWFRKRWEAYTDGWPRMKDDVDVTENDIERYGLLLLGRPLENSLVDKVAAELPIAFEGDGFVFNGKKYEGRDVGMALVYPNPLNRSRYVGVFAGAYYGKTLPVNHPFDGIPDYIIFEARPVTSPNEGLSRVFQRPDRHLCAGFFDSDWKIDPEAMWVR